MTDRIRQLVRELHQRSLWQVLGVYIVGSWVVFQVVESLYEGLGLPDWVPPTAIVLLLLGLPLVLATAFVQEGPPKLAATPQTREGKHDEAPGGLFTWRRTVTAVVLGFAGLGVAVSGFMGMRVLGIGPAATLVSRGELEAHAPIVLARFDNATSDSLLADAVREALRMDLVESSVVSPASATAITEVLARMRRPPTTPLTVEVAREVAVRQGWPAVLTGRVGELGNSYVLTAELITADSGRVLAGFRETASTDAVVEAVDRLSDAIREKAGESLRSIRAAKPLPEATTESLDALRAYAAGNPVEAVEIDSTFAAAWTVLAVAYSRTGYTRAREVNAAEHAYRLRDRLNPVERGRAAGVYHMDFTGDWAAAANAFRGVLVIQPNDETATTNLAVALSRMHDFTAAERLYVKAEQLNPTNPLTRFNHAGILYAEGKVDSALAVLAQPDSVLTYRSWTERLKAELAAAEGDYDRAMARLDTLRAVSPGVLSPGSYFSYVIQENIEATRGHLAEAVELGSLLEEGSRQVSLPPLRLAHAARPVLLLGYAGLDTHAVVEHLDALRDELKLQQQSPLAHPYGLLAEAYAAAGLVQDAEKQLAAFDAVDARIGTTTTDENRFRIARARALLALRAGQPDRALAVLRSARTVPCTKDEWTLPDLCFAALEGRAHELAGRPDSAIAAYERYLAVKTNARHSLDAVDLATVLERLGDLYEQRGDRDLAATYYARFVNLWQDADPPLQPRVAAARRALARLAAEP
jgi:tetratricopeptide (TPR) repeat protein